MYLPFLPFRHDGGLPLLALGTACLGRVTDLQFGRIRTNTGQSTVPLMSSCRSNFGALVTTLHCSLRSLEWIERIWRIASKQSGKVHVYVSNFALAPSLF